MAFYTYLKFDGEPLPLPVSYEVGMSDVLADSGGETEAGTTQRDIVRNRVVNISVSFQVTRIWLIKLTVYKKQDKIAVHYFDPETMEMKKTEMYIDGFKVKLEKDPAIRGCGR